MTTDESVPGGGAPAPRVRRVRYAGKHPRNFAEKYKEHDPARYPEALAKVMASGKTPAGSHRPIMVAEILDALAPRPGEVVVDCTLGFGGHARELLARVVPGGRLLGFDLDPLEQTRTVERMRAAGHGGDVFTPVRGNFAGLLAGLAAHGLAGADVILADLGVSSMQLDDPARGFSYKTDGPLDLRMNPARGRTAAEWLAAADLRRLAGVLRENADEPMADALAAEILAARDRAPIGRTRGLATTLHEILRRRGWTRDKAEGDARVRRVFQALRIEVNDEFGALDALLRQLPAALGPGGRVAILTFHSGEDRRVKHAFMEGARSGVYAAVCDAPGRPSPEETRANSRAAPAKLRWAVRSDAPA